MALQITDPGIFLPTIEIPTTAQFINAANWTYGRDEAALPADLRAFTVAGQHLTLEITDDGFYGAAFLTPDDQVVIAFEGTHLSALEEQPAFVARADRCGRADLPGPIARRLRRRAELHPGRDRRGRGAGDRPGRCLPHRPLARRRGGAVRRGAARPGGETYGGPGIPADAVPPSAVSRLTNYVERGDPIGNYSANPDVLNGFLFSDDILRFGSPTYLRGLLAGAGARSGRRAVRARHDPGAERRGAHRARRPRGRGPSADHLRRTISA